MPQASTVLYVREIYIGELESFVGDDAILPMGV